MTNLSVMSEQQLPHHSSLHPRSYDKLGSSPAFTASVPTTSAVALTYSLPSLAHSVHHEGQLYKRSSILKQWHPAYYVLDDTTLITYPTQATYQQIASQPPSPSHQQYKRVELSEFSVKSLSPSAHNRPYCFTLLSRETGKEHLFSAPTEQARTGWIDAIHKSTKAADVARRDRANSKDKAAIDVSQHESGEKSELVSGAVHGRRRRSDEWQGPLQQRAHHVVLVVVARLHHAQHVRLHVVQLPLLRRRRVPLLPLALHTPHFDPYPAPAVLARSVTAVRFTL